MKVLSVIVLCIVLLFSILGYSQFKTTTIEELKGIKSFFGKTVILEGYVYRNQEYTLPILVTNPKVYAGNTPMLCNQYLMLTGNTKFLPHRGMGTNHVRVKGICHECYGGNVCLDVIWYGLALSIKLRKEVKK